MKKQYWYMALSITPRLGGPEKYKNAICYTEHPVMALATINQRTPEFVTVLLYSTLLPDDFPDDLIEKWEY